MALINRCPACGSRRVKQVVSLEGCGFQIIQIMMILTIVGIPIALMMKEPRKTMKCKKCGAKWTV